jgi:SAM-dependent methyltransferase
MELGPRFEIDWFRSSFDALYPLLYRHRDLEEADRFVAGLAQRYPLDAGRILDLGCGPGRHLVALEKRGIAAIGLDLSASLLEGARRRLSRPMLVRGDMRELPHPAGSFAWVLVMFTTFGYFPGDEQNRHVLSEIARVLEGGGGLVLDLHNAPETRRSLVPHSSRNVDGLWIEERRWVEPDGRFLRKTTSVREDPTGDARSYDERVRLYEEPEITGMLESHGFRIVERWGGYDACPFEVERSRRLLVLARREAAAG